MRSEKDKIISPVEERDGTGARVKRLFPSRNIQHHDPFVLLDEFFVDPRTGFPMHKHAGFEAITYLLDGKFKHEDNMGNSSIITAGGAQRFTAGKGIEHSEMPEGDERAHGFQLWLNLPYDVKRTEPSYQEIPSLEIPSDERASERIRTVVGEGSPVRTHTDMLFLDIHLDEGGEFDIEVPRNFNGFLYLYSGNEGIKVNDVLLKTDQALLLEDKESLLVKTEELSKMIVVAGEPLNEPIEMNEGIVE